MFYYLFLGIIIGLLAERFLFPIIDLATEIITYRLSVNATKYQIQSQTIAKEFEKKYPEVEECGTHAIGFHCEDMAEDYDEDDFEDKRIGFKKSK